MSPLVTKAQSLMFKSQTPWSIARKLKKSREVQEGRLEEGKPQKAKKAAKPNKMTKKEQRKAQKSKKSSKSVQKLKINTPPEINYHNSLNASSPP
jgi:hypothetical protein